MLTNRDFIVTLGIPFENWIPFAVEKANSLGINDIHDERITSIINETKSLPQFNKVAMRKEPLPFHVNLDKGSNFSNADNDYLSKNHEQVISVMNNIMRIPTIVEGAVMPDACHAGIICVGGVVGAKNAIHPAFHSADICCSMSLTEFDTDDSKSVLDTAMSVTHFGPTGRPVPEKMPQWLIDRINSNRLTKALIESAQRDFATQGDGNHFLFVGKSKNTGKVCVVTHHGSRSFGAKLYKVGMKIAKKFAEQIAPDEIAKNQPLSIGYRGGDLAWIPFDTDEGREYWEALQIVRDWTEANHQRIHDLIQEKLNVNVLDHFWNEHNFVFKRGDIFYHAKGATPGFDGYERTLVPLNMSEPVLVTRGTNVENGIGFLPHGAGRNMGRKEFQRRFPNPELPANIDVRSFSGTLDTSELPQAYKNAQEVKYQMIEKYKLAEVLDEILPYGSIMAGECQIDYSKFKKKKS